MTEISVTNQNSYSLSVSGSNYTLLVPSSGPVGRGIPVGGSPGQILSKASVNDYDTTWVDALSGGDGSGFATTADLVSVSGSLYSLIVSTSGQGGTGDVTSAELVAVSGALHTQIVSVSASQGAAITTETAARIAADSSEAATRAAADTALSTLVATASGNLASSIAGEATARAAADSSEATTRASADTTLQANIDAEEAARIAADDALYALMTTISAGPGVLNDSFDLNTSDLTYTITHDEVTGGGNPVATLVAPSSGAIGYGLFISDITDTSFNVTLSEVPAASGYSIDWHLVAGSGGSGGGGGGGGSSDDIKTPYAVAQLAGDLGTISTTTWTMIPWNSIVVDTDSTMSGGTFTAPKAGWYNITAQALIFLFADLNGCRLGAYKNGSNCIYGPPNFRSGSDEIANCVAMLTGDVYLDIGDTLETWVWYDGSSASIYAEPQTPPDRSRVSYMSIKYLGSTP
jgi:hypothetical protein